MKKWLGAAAALILAGVTMIGCGGDGDGQASGSSTIRGNIVSYDTDALAGMVVTYPQTVIHPDPITVTLDGTSFSATTSGDGIFVHDGIPPGTYMMSFLLAGRKLGSYSITVEADVIIMLNDITIGPTGVVSVRETTFTPKPVSPTGASIEGVWHGYVRQTQGTGVEGNGEIYFTFNGDGTFTAQAADGDGRGPYSVNGNNVSGTILSAGGTGDVDTAFSGTFTDTTMNLTWSAPRTGGGTDAGTVSLTKE